MCETDAMHKDQTACDASGKCEYSAHYGGFCYAKDDSDQSALDACEDGTLDTGKADCEGVSKCVWIADAAQIDAAGFGSSLEQGSQSEAAYLDELYSVLPSNDKLTCTAESIASTTIYALSFQEALRKYFTTGKADEEVLVDLALSVEDYVGGETYVMAYLDSKTGEEYGSGQGGPVTDKAVIAAFEQSDIAKKNRAAAAAFGQILTAPPHGRGKSKTKGGGINRPVAPTDADKAVTPPGPAPATPATVTPTENAISAGHVALPCLVTLVAFMFAALQTVA